jgi:Cu-Zn family superoxide dismutase
MKKLAVAVPVVVLAGAAWLLARPALQTPSKAADAATASAEMKNAQGETVGQARLQETPNGVLVTVTFTKAPAGEHAFHVHETGRCEAPKFESAGGHFSPDGKQHGFMDAKGPHAGDLPNVHVPEDGKLEFEFLIDRVTLREGKSSLLDRDGAALVLHAGADDYKTNPSGGAGDRIACGVIR